MNRSENLKKIKAISEQLSDDVHIPVHIVDNLEEMKNSLIKILVLLDDPIFDKNDAHVKED